MDALSEWVWRSRRVGLHRTCGSRWLIHINKHLILKMAKQELVQIERLILGLIDKALAKMYETVNISFVRYRLNNCTKVS